MRVGLLRLSWGSGGSGGSGGHLSVFLRFQRVAVSLLFT